MHLWRGLVVHNLGFLLGTCGAHAAVAGMKRVKERSRNEAAEVSRSSNSGPASASTYYAGCFGDAIKTM